MCYGLTIHKRIFHWTSNNLSVPANDSNSEYNLTHSYCCIQLHNKCGAVLLKTTVNKMGEIILTISQSQYQQL